MHVKHQLMLIAILLSSAVKCYKLAQASGLDDLEGLIKVHDREEPHSVCGDCADSWSQLSSSIIVKCQLPSIAKIVLQNNTSTHIAEYLNRLFTRPVLRTA